MYGYGKRHMVAVRVIALAVVCLFTVNNISWALPSEAGKRETTTLQVQSIFNPILETTEALSRTQAVYELRTVIANALRNVPIQDINARLDIGYAGSDTEKKYRLLRVISVDAGEETVVDMSLLGDPDNRLKYRLRMRDCRSLDDVFENPDKLDIVIYDEEGRVSRDTAQERVSEVTAEEPADSNRVVTVRSVSSDTGGAATAKDFVIERIALWEAPEQNPDLFRELIEIDRGISKKTGWTYKGIEIDPEKTAEMRDAFVYKATDPSTGKAVGYILAGPGLRRGEAHIFSTAVVKEWQGSGVWKAMAEEALQFLRNSKVKALTMCIEADNARMLRFMETFMNRIFRLDLLEHRVLDGVRFISYDIRERKGFWAKVWAQASIRAGARPASLSDTTRSSLAALNDSKAWKTFVFGSTFFHERVGHILLAQIIWLFGHGPRPAYTWGEIFRGEIKTRIHGFAGGLGGVIGNLIGTVIGALMVEGSLVSANIGALPLEIAFPVLTFTFFLGMYTALTNMYSVFVELLAYPFGAGDIYQYREERLSNRLERIMDGRFQIGGEIERHGHRIDGGKSTGRNGDDAREQLVVEYSRDRILRGFTRRFMFRLYTKIVSDMGLATAVKILASRIRGRRKDVELSGRTRGWLLRAVYDTVMDMIIYDGEYVDELSNQYRGVPILIGDAAIGPRRGVCRHHGIVVAALLERLIRQGYIYGDVFYVRGGGHGWAEFRDSRGDMYVLDVARGYFGPKSEAAGYYDGYLPEDEVDEITIDGAYEQTMVALPSSPGASDRGAAEDSEDSDEWPDWDLWAEDNDETVTAPTIDPDREAPEDVADSDGEPYWREGDEDDTWTPIGLDPDDDETGTAPTIDPYEDEIPTASGLNPREELDRVIMWNEPEGRYDPSALLDFMRTRRGFAGTYDADAGLWEGFSLEQHTAMVQDNFEKYGLAARLPEVEGLNVLPLVRFALVVHDIGKPAAIESGYATSPRENTLAIVRSEMSEMGFSGREIDFVSALIDGDPIGGLIQTEIPTAGEAYWNISVMAEHAGLPVKTFFDILLPYYTADVCAYEGPRTDYFVEEGDSIYPRREHPHMEPYWRLAAMMDGTSAPDLLPVSVFGPPAGDDTARLRELFDGEFGAWNDMRAKGMARAATEEMEDMCRQIAPEGVEALLRAFFMNDECLAEFAPTSLGIEYCLRDGDRDGAAELMLEFLGTQDVLQFDINMKINGEDMRLVEDWANKFGEMKARYIRLTQWDFLNRFSGAGGMVLWRSTTVGEENEEGHDGKKAGENAVFSERHFTQIPYYAMSFHGETVVRAFVPVASIRQTSWLSRPRVSDDYEPEVLVSGEVNFLSLHRTGEGEPLGMLRRSYEKILKATPNTDARDLRIIEEEMTSEEVLNRGRDIQTRFFDEMKRKAAVAGAAVETREQEPARSPQADTFRARVDAVTNGMEDGEYAFEDILERGDGRITEYLASVMTGIYIDAFLEGGMTSKPYVQGIYLEILPSLESKITYFAVRSGRIEGFLQMSTVDHEGAAVLNWIAVSSALHGRGVGAALADNALNTLVESVEDFHTLEIKAAANAVTFYTDKYFPERSEETSPYGWYLTYEIPVDEVREEALRVYGPELAPDVGITVHIHRRAPPPQKEEVASPAQEIIKDLKLEDYEEAVEALETLEKTGALTADNREKFKGLFAYFNRKRALTYTGSYMITVCHDIERLARTGMPEVVDPDLLLKIAGSCGAETHTAYYVLAELAFAVWQNVRDNYTRDKILGTEMLIAIAGREREAAFGMYVRLSTLAQKVQEENFIEAVGYVLRKDSYSMFREKLRFFSEIARKNINEEIIGYALNHMNTKVDGQDRLSFLRGMNNVLSNGGMTSDDTLRHWRLFLENYVKDFGFLANRHIMLAYRHIATGEEMDPAALRSYALPELGVTERGEIGIAQFAKAVGAKKELVFQSEGLSEADVSNPMVAGILGLMTGFSAANWGHGSYGGQDLVEFITDFYRGSANITPLSENLKGVEGRFLVARPVSDEGLLTIFERYKNIVRHALELSRAPQDEAVEVMRDRTVAALRDKREDLREKLARVENEIGRKNLETQIGRITDVIAAVGEMSSCAAMPAMLAEQIPGLVNKDGILQSMTILGTLTEYFSQDAAAGERMAFAVDDSVVMFGGELLVLEEKMKAGEIVGIPAKARKNVLKVLRVRLFREYAERVESRDQSVERSEVRAFMTKGLLGEMAGDIGDACYTSQADIMQEDSMVGSVIFTTGEGADRELMGSMLILENSIGGEKTWILRATNPGDSFIEGHDAGEFLAGVVAYVKTLALKEGVRHIVAPVGEPHALSNRAPVISAYDDVVSGNTVHLDHPETFNGYDIQDACRTVAVLGAEDAVELAKEMPDTPLTRIPAKDVRNILVFGETAKAEKKVGETALDLWPLISSVHDRYPDATIYVASGFSGMFMQESFDGKIISIPSSEEEMEAWGYDTAEWEGSKLGDLSGSDAESRKRMKRFISQREVDLIFDVSIMSMQFHRIYPPSTPGELGPHIFAMDSAASMSSVSGARPMREPNEAVYRDREGREHPLPEVKAAMSSDETGGLIPEGGTWGASIAMCRALGLDVSESDLKVAELGEENAVEAMRFVEECYYASHPDKPAGSFDSSKKIVLVNVYAITQSGMMESDDWVVALRALASNLKDSYLLFTRGGEMDVDRRYADMVSAALGNNGNDILLPRTNLHPHINEILGISSGLLTLDTGMSHIGNGIYGVPTAIVTKSTILHWLPPRENVKKIVIPTMEDLRQPFMYTGGDGFPGLMKRMTRRKREILAEALKKYAESINDTPERPEVLRAKEKFREHEKAEEDAKARPLKRGNIVYGYFMPSTGQITVDIARTRAAFRRVAPGLSAVEKHKVTGFVHAHEIFHLLMDREGRDLDEKEEEFLAYAFAKRTLGLELTSKERRDLDELTEGVDDAAVRRQLATPYESSEFLLNLARMGIDIYGIAGDSIAEVPDGAKTIIVPPEGDNITGPFIAGDTVYNAEVTFDTEEIIAEITAWSHAHGAERRYFSDEQWMRAVQRDIEAGNTAFLAKLVSEAGEVLGITYRHKAPFTFITGFGMRSRNIYQGDFMEIADGHRGQGMGEVLLAKALDVVITDLSRGRTDLGVDDFMEIIQTEEEDAQGIFVIQPADDREYAEEGRRAVDFFRKNGFHVLRYPGQESLSEEDYDHTLFMAISLNNAETLIETVREKIYSPPKETKLKQLRLFPDDWGITPLLVFIAGSLMMPSSADAAVVLTGVARETASSAVPWIPIIGVAVLAVAAAVAVRVFISGRHDGTESGYFRSGDLEAERNGSPRSEMGEILARVKELSGMDYRAFEDLMHWVDLYEKGFRSRIRRSVRHLEAGDVIELVGLGIRYMELSRSQHKGNAAERAEKWEDLLKLSVRTSSLSHAIQCAVSKYVDDAGYEDLINERAPAGVLEIDAELGQRRGRETNRLLARLFALSIAVSATDARADVVELVFDELKSLRPEMDESLRETIAAVRKGNLYLDTARVEETYEVFWNNVESGTYDRKRLPGELYDFIYETLNAAEGVRSFTRVQIMEYLADNPGDAEAGFGVITQKAFEDYPFHHLASDVRRRLRGEGGSGEMAPGEFDGIIARMEANGENMTPDNFFKERARTQAASPRGWRGLVSRVFPDGVGQIGRRARVIRLREDGGEMKADVRDAVGAERELALKSRGKLDVSKLKRKVKHMHDVSPEHKDTILSMLSLLENAPPDVYVFDDLIEDLFGFASPRNEVIALHSYFADDPVALAHEALEYITRGRSKLLRIKFKGGLALWVKRIGLYEWLKKLGWIKGRLLLSDTQGNSIGEIPLGGEALSIALKGASTQHYMLRALQREVFGNRDRSLTVRVQDIRSGTVIGSHARVPEMWSYESLDEVEPMRGMTRRVVTAGDIHGEFQGLREILEGTGLIRRGRGFDGLDDEWTGGNALLIQGGDVMDRGPESMQAMHYLRYLKEIAEEKGGDVVRLIGNHELMYLYKNDNGRFSGPVKQAVKDGVFRGLDPELWNDDAELVRMLREDVAAGRIVGAYEAGGKVFVHGVVMPELVEVLGEERSADMRDPAMFAGTVNDILRKAVEDNNFESIIFSVGIGVISSEIEGIATYYLHNVNHKEINKLPFDQIVFHDPSWFKDMEEILVRTSPGTRRTIIGGDVGMTAIYGGGRAAVAFEDGRAFAAYPDSMVPKRTKFPIVDAPEPTGDTGRPLDALGVPSLGKSLLRSEGQDTSSGQDEEIVRDIFLNMGLSGGESKYGPLGIDDAYQLALTVLGEKPVFFGFNNRNVSVGRLASSEKGLVAMAAGKYPVLYNEGQVRAIIEGDRAFYGRFLRRGWEHDDGVSSSEIREILMRVFSFGEGDEGGELMGYASRTPGAANITFWRETEPGDPLLNGDHLYGYSAQVFGREEKQQAENVFRAMNRIAGIIGERAPLVLELREDERSSHFKMVNGELREVVYEDDAERLKEAEKTIKGTAARRRALFPRAAAYIADALKAARDKGEDIPIDIRIDLSLISPKDLQANMNTWACLILACAETENVNFVFEALDTEAGEANRQETAALYALERGLKDNAYLAPAGMGVEKILSERVAQGRRNNEGAIEILLWSKTRLKHMSQERRRGKTGIELTDLQYPVALDDTALAKFSGERLMNFEAAVTVGLCVAALAVAKRVGGEAEVDNLIGGEDSRLLRRVQKLYGVLLPGRTITAETLRDMIYADQDPDRDETDVKLHLAIDLALPPITRMPVEGLKELHKMIQQALRSA